MQVFDSWWRLENAHAHVEQVFTALVYNNTFGYAELIWIICYCFAKK